MDVAGLGGMFISCAMIPTVMCNQCDEQARGICQLCGRGVCSQHHSSLPSLVAIYGQDPPRAIVVSDTLWCGICRPQPEPISMPELA